MGGKHQPGEHSLRPQGSPLSARTHAYLTYPIFKLIEWVQRLCTNSSQERNDASSKDEKEQEHRAV